MNGAVMKLIKLLYYKWIRRGCPHICALCCVKDLCKTGTIDDLINDMKLYLE